MSKYEPLAHLLDSSDVDELPLTFADIERALRTPLPPSASAYREWWANDKTHSQSKAWTAAGWQVWSVDLNAHRVVFRRSDAKPRSPGRPPKARGMLEVPLNSLSAAAMRLIEDYVAEHRCDLSAAAAAVLNAAGAERRKALFDWFDANGAGKPGASSAELIREDRDAR